MTMTNRRDFLKQVAAAGVACSMPNLAAHTSAMP